MFRADAFLKAQTATQLRALKDIKLIYPKFYHKLLVEKFPSLVDEFNTGFKNLMNK